MKNEKNSKKELDAIKRAKGAENESKVLDEVYEIKEKLKLSDTDVSIKPNVYFNYSSPYGPQGVMTMEIDLLIITQFLILVIEIKSAKFDFMNYSFAFWETIYQEEEYNAIWQNQTHKDILCSLFPNIPTSNVIAVEILLGENDLSVFSHSANNYVFGKDNYRKGLYRLLSCKKGLKIPKDDIVSLIERKRVFCTREKHQEDVDNLITTMKALKKHAPQSTVTIPCPECQSATFYEKQGKKYKLKCPNGCCELDAYHKSRLSITPMHIPYSTRNDYVYELLRYL